MILIILLFTFSILGAIIVAYFGRDELIDGRKYIFYLGNCSAIFSVFFAINKNWSEMFSSIAIILITGISYQLSFEKKFAIERKR
jgi:ABC-type uncharacterized transport system permease subunit